MLFSASQNQDKSNFGELLDNKETKYLDKFCWPNPKIKVCCVQVKGFEYVEEDSVINPVEVEVLVNTLNTFLGYKEPFKNTKDIGIVTPYLG